MEFSPKINSIDSNEWSPIPEVTPTVTASDIWNPDGTPNTRPFGVETTIQPAPDGYGFIDPNQQHATHIEIQEANRNTLQQKVDNFRNTAFATIITGSTVWAGAETVKPGITQDVYETTQKVFEHTPGGPLTIAVGSAALLGASLWAKLRTPKEQNYKSTNSPER